MAIVLLLAFGGTEAMADAPGADTRVKLAVQTVLQVGLTDDADLRAVKSTFERARRTARRDSRLNYAWGLVLLHYNELDEAAGQFELTARGNDASTMPARRALAWSQWVGGHELKSLQTVAAISVSLVEQTSGKEPEISELATAVWLGKFLGAAAQTASDETHLAEAKKLADQMPKVFEDALAAAFLAGQKDFETRLEKLQAEVDRANATAQKRFDQKLESQTADIDEALDDTEKEKQDSKLLAQDAKAWLDETTRRIDRELGRLERDYSFLADRDRRAAQTMVEVRKRMTYIEALGQRGVRGRNFRNPQVPSWQTLQEQMAQLEQERLTLALQAGEIARRGQLMMLAKQRAIATYQQETGRLVRKSADLDKWQERLAQQKESLADSQANRPADRKLKSFRTLMPFDFAAARRNLEESFESRQESQP